ncbi:MAG: PilN domain-containing protein [Candidatus Saccharimonadales bacterium]
MINLLPDNNKKELHAARMNVVLLRYNILTVSAVVILLLIVGGFYAYLVTTKTQAEAANSANQEKVAEYNSTKQDAAEYRQNLATAKQILNNQVNYSSLVFRITELLPKGTVLDNVNLSAQDFGNQMTITAHAKDYAAVSQLKQNFEQSTVFDNVFFQNINTGSDGSYPITVDISVKINKVDQ